jgi:hypothetical protein
VDKGDCASTGMDAAAAVEAALLVAAKDEIGTALCLGAYTALPWLLGP